MLVVNATAGSAEKDALREVERVLGSASACDLVETEGPDHVDEVLAGLDGRQVVVAGGDGSVHLTVERLRHAGQLAEVAVGWIPLGTGNDLARTLGVPLEPVEAAEAILAGRPQELDLIVSDDGIVCVNALHAGAGVDAAARAENLKDRVGGFAYPLGALAAGATAEGWDLEIELDGAPLRPQADGPVLLVAVMNGRTFGGGTVMAPDAAPDDGSLDVVVCSPLGPAQRAAFGVALQTGNHLDRDDVASGRGRTVRITGEPVGYNVDGELEDQEVVERSFHVDPGSWSLIVPDRSVVPGR